MLNGTCRLRGEAAHRLDNVVFEVAPESIGDGACVVGCDGPILAWNRAAERILGYTAREVVGRPCCDVFGGHDESGNRLCYPGCHVMALVKRSEPIRHFQMEAQKKAGQRVWLDVSIIPIASTARDGSSAVLHLFRDVTSMREMLTLIHERDTAGGAAGAADAALTRREIDVLRLVATGLKTRPIGDRLHVSQATIRNHVQNILGKLGAHSRLEAVAYARQHRLL